jgi:hypothetical protein
MESTQKIATNILLKNLPSDVNDIIRKEQLRLELHENERLKKEHVVYKIVREWLKLYKTNKK